MRANRARSSGRILCYHSIGQAASGVNDVRPKQFCRQIELALRSGFRFVPPPQIALRGGNPTDLAITFDDGWTSVLSAAAPILRDYNIPWLLFVVSGWSDHRSGWAKEFILPWRNIVGDNGLGPETVAVAEEFGAIYLKASTRGASAARNVSLKAATGEFLAFLDDDDVWLPGNVHPHIALLDLHSALDAAIGKAVYTDPHLVPCGVPWPKDTPADGDQLLRSMLSGFFRQIGTTLARTIAREKIGNFDETLIGGEDLDWLLRLARKKRLGFVATPCILFRGRPAGSYDALQRKRISYDRRVFFRHALPEWRIWRSPIDLSKASAGTLMHFYRYFVDAAAERAERGERRHALRAIATALSIFPFRGTYHLIAPRPLRKAFWASIVARRRTRTNETTGYQDLRRRTQAKTLRGPGVEWIPRCTILRSVWPLDSLPHVTAPIASIVRRTPESSAALSHFARERTKERRLTIETSGTKGAVCVGRSERPRCADLSRKSAHQACKSRDLVQTGSREACTGHESSRADLTKTDLTTPVGPLASVASYLERVAQSGIRRGRGRRPVSPPEKVCAIRRSFTTAEVRNPGCRKAIILGLGYIGKTIAQKLIPLSKRSWCGKLVHVTRLKRWRPAIVKKENGPMDSVDVVIPCYNYGRYLRYCVESVLTQRDVNVRLLIIDDASSDDTGKIAEQLSSCDRRVQFRRHDNNRGLIETANEGIMLWASAKYTLLIGADDMLSPGALGRAALVMEGNPQVGLVYGMALKFCGDGAPAYSLDEKTPGYRVISGTRFLQRSCEFGNPVPTPTVVVRTELQQRLGGYCPAFPHTSDMEMWMRFATQCPIGILPSIQAFYRWHGNNMSANYYGQKLGDRRERILTCRHVLNRWGRDIASFPMWVDAMERRLSLEALQLASVFFETDDGNDWRDMLAFAVEQNPELLRSRVWWRLSAKRFIGRSATRALRNIARLTGGNKQTYSISEQPQWHEDAHQIGWWPNSGELPNAPQEHGQITLAN